METSSISTLHARVARSTTSLAVAAILAAVGWSSSASAAQCLADAAGTSVNCTANDLGLAGATNVTGDTTNCTQNGGTLTFSGDLDVDAASPTRYDIGFYIASDSVQALTGQCTVVAAPATGVYDIDSDQCGDVPGSTPLSVHVTDVTVACKDQDSDGFFDIFVCAGYAQNAQTECNGPDDLAAGTKSKCQCDFVPTDLPTPHCTDDPTLCVDDGNPCTDIVCHPRGEAGGDFFGCETVNNSTPCPDGLFCNGVDVCAGGTCTHPGNPCTGGGVCESCNETDDNCFAAAGTLCRGAVNLCDIAENCTGSSTSCPANQFQPTTIVCRASAGVCDPQEVCTGTSAACQATGFLPSNTVCRASTGVCDPAELCTGSTGACPGDSFLPSSTICRASAGECDVAEQCTGSTGPCPGDGFKGNGTGCTPDSNICTDDECNGVDATCHHPNNSDPCNDNNQCTEGDICSGGTCTGGSPLSCDDQDDCTEDTCVPASGCVNNLICADICRSPGYWATHSGYEKDGSVNVAQTLLDIVGPLSVCGQTISATSNQDSPFLDGLGLTSDLQGLCMKTKGVHQRQLYRQLVAAALNCAASGATDCDNVANTYMDVDFQDCSDICAGLPVVDPPTVGECIGQLDCFNNGGQVILGTGKCATGTCPNEQVLTYCGGDFGACPLINEVAQDCVAFENNCHAQAMCNEEINFCPKNTPASSPKACQEARFDDCTIDDCAP